MLDTKYFTGEFRADINYIGDFANPKDHTLDGARRGGRTGEVQVQQIGVGGDFHYDNVRGRFMTQFGMYSELTPRDDASPARGQWDLTDAYRYISEAYGGYHFNVWNGINVDAGIFMSYIGLFSYYNYDNWAYQPSYVSANTPWFFNGIRIQTFPSDKLKIEYWIINGWQSYGMFNDAPGLGTEIRWRPTGSLEFITNDYWGYDTPNTPARGRYHSDNSVQVKYLDHPGVILRQVGVFGDVGRRLRIGRRRRVRQRDPERPAQYFLGYMVYDRMWFHKDLFGLTFGNGAITNPGRYLVLLPPINGATAASGTPYFPTSPGSPFNAWDTSITFDYMPKQYITFRAEFNHREANVPYFVGTGRHHAARGQHRRRRVYRSGMDTRPPQDGERASTSPCWSRCDGRHELSGSPDPARAGEAQAVYRIVRRGREDVPDADRGARSAAPGRRHRRRIRGGARPDRDRGPDRRPRGHSAAHASNTAASRWRRWMSMP